MKSKNLKPKQKPIAEKDQREKLVVKKSIAGLGLFATAPIKKGTFVIEYTGPLLSDEEVDAKGGKYLFALGSKWTIDGANLSIEYGRPAIKGRADADVMPNGQPWRMGADEATVLKTDKPLKFGTLSLQPGTYTLNTEPGEKQWQLLVGKLGKPGQWGIPYNAALEIGRAPMTVQPAKSPAEQVTISIDDTPQGGTLRVECGTKSASIPFTVG